MPRLLTELRIAHGEGTIPKLYRDLARIAVLILDDWGLAPIDAARARDLLEILDDRIGRRSVIITSQLPVADWHRQINDPTVADAILDRLVHGAHPHRAARHVHAHRRRWRRNKGMSATTERRAERGAIVAPLRGVGEAGRMVPGMERARRPTREGSHASRAHHAPPPCSQAFGGGTDHGEIAEGEPPTTT